MREYKINWSHAPSSTMPDFFKRYTLHDAAWKGAISSPFRRDLITVFSWDTWYAVNHIPKLAPLEHPPYLVIRFPHIYALYFPGNNPAANYHFLISSAWSNHLSEEEDGLFHPQMGDVHQDAFHTVIQGFAKESVHILHTEKIQVRCYTTKGKEIALPNN